jgi:hypothetical protein
MDAITIEGKDYYAAEALRDCDPAFFYGCSRGIRLIIARKNIPSADHAFACAAGNSWKVSTAANRKARLFISTEYARVNVPKLQVVQSVQSVQAATVTHVIEQPAASIPQEYEEAPSVLALEDPEKFHDGEHALDIETRGERHPEKIYFRVKDVSREFDMKLLKKCLTNEDGKYVRGSHYKTFSVVTSSTNSGRRHVKPTLYLTYKGMLKVLFNSHGGKAEPFVDWATKTLFTTQMGTPKAKDKLVAKLRGVSYDTIQELFSINACSTPCVYLTALGSVGVLRKSMNIPAAHADDSIVYKFGLTRDFEKRKNGHTAEYKELPTDMKLVSFAYIDPQYLGEAESTLAGKLEGYKIEYKKHTELLVLDRRAYTHATDAIELIGRKYSGHTQEFQAKIAELTAKVAQLQREIETSRETAARDRETAVTAAIHTTTLTVTHKYELELMRQSHAAELGLKDAVHRAEIAEKVLAAVQARA